MTLSNKNDIYLHYNKIPFVIIQNTFIAWIFWLVQLYLKEVETLTIVDTTALVQLTLDAVLEEEHQNNASILQRELV